MTLKELAEVAGVSPATVRRTAKELFPEKFQNGVRTIFDEFQSMEIMKEVTKKNMVALQNEKLPLQNEKLPLQNEKLPTQNVEVIAQAFAMAMKSVMPLMMKEMFEMNKQQLQIEAPKQDYFSLIAYCSLHKIKTVSSELRKMGMDLRKMAKESGKELHKIPDERYGQVNSYPVEILNEYFSE